MKKIVLILLTLLNISCNLFSTKLHEAVKVGNLLYAQELINSGYNIDTVNNQGETPIFTAITLFKNKILEHFLLQGAKIDAINNQGLSALHIALLNNNLDAFNLLLMYGGDELLSLQDSLGLTPIHYIAVSNNIEAIKILTTFNIPWNLNINIKDNYGNTALHHAVNFNNLVISQLLLDFQADINAFNNEEETPLFFAVKNNNKDLVLILLNKKAKVNIINHLGYTPLFLSIENNAVEIQKILKEYGAYEIYMLYGALKYKNFNLASILINKGININQKLPFTIPVFCQESKSIIFVGTKYNLIHIFISEQDVKSIIFLINNGIDVNAKGTFAGYNLNKVDNVTPLHRLSDYFYQNDLLNIASLLLASGADINSQNSLGETPLVSTINQFIPNKRKFALFLINRGADITIPENRGNTPLHYACHHNDVDIIKVLLKHPKVNLNSQNKDGNAPLHLFRKKNALECLLASKKLDIYVKNKSGNTVIHNMSHSGHHTYIKSIIKHYPDANFNLVHSEGNTPIILSLESNKYKLKPKIITTQLYNTLFYILYLRFNDSAYIIMQYLAGKFVPYKKQTHKKIQSKKRARPKYFSKDGPILKKLKL